MTTQDPTGFALVVGSLFALAFLGLGLRPLWVVRWPRSVLGLTAAISLVSVLALVEVDPLGLDLAIDASTEPLLPSGDPARAVYEQSVRDFGEDEIYVVAMETTDLFRAEALGTLRRVHDRIARLPEVRRVQSLSDVVSFRYVAEDDWLEVGSFMEEIPTEPAALAALRQRALKDPLYRRTLVSEDGRTAAVNVSFRRTGDQEFIRSRLDERVMAILAEEARPGIRFHVAGRPHVKARVYHRMLADLRVLIPAALAVLALGLGLVFGTRRGVVLPVGLVMIATLWTFGAMAWLDRSLSVLTTLLAPMLIAIGSVYGIHALSRYEEEAISAADPAAAVRACIGHLRVPVLIAGLTTMAGFGALLISDVPAVFELGAFSVLGVASLTLLCLGALHAALTLMPLPRDRAATPPRAARRAAGLAHALDAALGRLGEATVRHAGGVLLVFAAVTGVCALAIPRIVIDTDYLSFFDPDSAVRRDFEAVNRLLAGAVPIYLTLRSEEPGGFREPEALRALQELQRGAEALPAVSRTLSVADTVAVMNRALARDDPAEERVPDTRGAVAELLFMAPKAHLDRYTNANHSRANVLVRTGAVGTAAVREVARGLEGVLQGADLPAGLSGDVTGNAILLSRSADGIARSQPRTVGLAAIAIFLLVSAGLGSARLGLAAMLPNVVPVVIFFGLLGFGVAPLSLPTSLIASIALGIAIDDTAHFLVRYRKERAAGATAQEAALVCVRRVGRPIAVTSAVLMAGFGVVSLSGFATLREFGALAAATMGVCLATDLLLLPALLTRLRV